MSCSGIVGPIGLIGAAGNSLTGPTGPAGSGIIGNTGPTGSTNIQSTLYVDGTYGNNATAITDNILKPYVTIQAAIDDANNGDRVVVQHGTYTEPLTVSNKNITIDFQQSTIIGSLTVTGSNTNLVVKGFPTIRNTGTNVGFIVTVSSGAVLTGKFKDIYSFLGGGVRYDNSGMSVTDSVAQISARDIDVNEQGINVTTTGSAEVNTRDISANFGDLNATHCILINNANFNGHIRDILQGTNATSNIFSRAIETTGSNPSLNIFARDLYEPNIGVVGGTIRCVNGQSNIAWRDTIQRGARLEEHIRINNSNANLSARDIRGRSNNHALIECFSGSNLKIVARLLENITEQRTNVLELSGSGSRNVTVIAHKSVTSRGAAVETNTNNTGISTIKYDSSIYQLSLNSNSVAFNNTIRNNCTGQLTGFTMSWGRFDIPCFDLDLANQLFKIDLCRLTRDNSTITTRELFNSNGQDGLKSYLRIHDLNTNADTISDTSLNTSEPDTSLISIRGAGKVSFEIDRLVNNETQTNGGFTTYIYSDQDLEVHFYNTVYQSPTLAIALEHDGTTGPAETLLENSAKLFFHGSHVILGTTGTGVFNTNSTSIVTIGPTGTTNRAVVVNEGRVNSNFDFESAAAKSNPVIEPITGPVGSKVINTLYYNLFNP